MQTSCSSSNASRTRRCRSPFSHTSLPRRCKNQSFLFPDWSTTWNSSYLYVLAHILLPQNARRQNSPLLVVVRLDPSVTISDCGANRSIAHLTVAVVLRLYLSSVYPIFSFCQHTDQDLHLRQYRWPKHDFEDQLAGSGVVVTVRFQIFWLVAVFFRCDSAKSCHSAQKEFIWYMYCWSEMNFGKR